MAIEKKEVTRLEIKATDDDEGRVRARFATLGVKDKDGDVIERGAFGEQAVKVSAYGHTSWGGALPVGKGVISESGDDAIADLQFFMNTQTGREHFEVVKELGALGEWSFGFNITEEGSPSEEQRQAGVHRVLKSLQVVEVSPVLVGAGVGTRTLSAKCDGCAAKGEDGAEAGGDESEEPAAPEPTAEEEQAGEGQDDPKAEDEGNHPTDVDLQEQIAREVGRFHAITTQTNR